MITISELHERKFFEINDSSSRMHTTEDPLVFANYTKGCMLIQNGEGYIPYVKISIFSEAGDGIPCTMITEVTQLDELLKQL